MRLAVKPMLRLEAFEIREAAPFFPQIIGEVRPIRDQHFLTLKVDLLQFAIELRRDASFLLR